MQCDTWQTLAMCRRAKADSPRPRSNIDRLQITPRMSTSVGCVNKATAVLAWPFSQADICAETKVQDEELSLCQTSLTSDFSVAKVEHVL